jgi:formylmethanofuran dehydrogenase subunit D
MTNEVRKHKHTAPFVPFVIKTSDGKQYRVKHPDYVAISPKGGRVVVFADEEATTTISALHIVAVEPQRSRARAR